jgi:hypothetical protein
MRSGRNRCTSYGQAVVSVKQPAAFTVQARTIHSAFSGESYQKTLVGAATEVLKFAGSASSPLRTRLHDLNDTPLFAGLTESIHKISGTAEKSHAN